MIQTSCNAVIQLIIETYSKSHRISMIIDDIVMCENAKKKFRIDYLSFGFSISRAYEIASSPYRERILSIA